jgi:aryl-alcohol dehydrogenase-like predicted oxidoreductase
LKLISNLDFIRWLQKQRREDFVIATKVRVPIGKGPNELGLSRKHILSCIENSLKNLQTDYIGKLFHCFVIY